LTICEQQAGGVVFSDRAASTAQIKGHLGL